ncbi:unnamed protein product [Dibothriocephalus latus]|uniref:Uncharacterized protein n=1 Tax=Dibothriocephalus latus TaxID=60516 RepID=A0A3P6QES9_DIBLA|nr:unnamed protein product [Dibothriocephalus latus]
MKNVNAKQQGFIIAGLYMDRTRTKKKRKCAGGTEQAEAPKDILVAVAELQNLSGFWKLEAELADLLDCQLEKLKSKKPQKCE